MPSITIDDLAGEITLAVKTYTEDVSEAVEKEIDSTAKDMVKDLKIDSPKNTGEYAKGWTSKRDTSGGSYKRVVHNKAKPGLVHLLEFGHQKVNGGRVGERPHLRPTYDRHAGKLEKAIKDIIKNGGVKS
mgnify:CR=1 FL=1